MKSLERKIESKLNSLIQQGAAPGFQLALGLRERTLGLYSVGSRDLRNKRPVTQKTWFDLASLTKIVSTVTLSLFSLDRKLLEDFSAPLQNWFPFFSSSLKEKSILDLLNHCAGLPPIFEEIDESCTTRPERIRFFLKKIDQDYEKNKLNKELYSDVGYMILGILLEQIHGKNLRDLFRDFYPENSQLSYGPLRFHWDWASTYLKYRNLAPSLSIDQPGEWISGISQDPRAVWFEGAAGHSGLFGTAWGVEQWAAEIYRAYHGKGLRLSDKLLRKALPLDEEHGRFVCGFDTPTGKRSQAGSLANPQTTIGFLGYTGCSFWMDIESGYRITLLSHRHARDANPDRLSALRPDFHDWLYEEVFLRAK